MQDLDIDLAVEILKLLDSRCIMSAVEVINRFANGNKIHVVFTYKTLIELGIVRREDDSLFVDAEWRCCKDYRQALMNLGDSYASR